MGKFVKASQLMVSCTFYSFVLLTGLTLEFEIFSLKLDAYARRLIGNTEGARMLRTLFKSLARIRRLRNKINRPKELMHTF